MDIDDRIVADDDPGWQIVCARPGCGHTLRDHDMVTTGGCIVADCLCRGFRNPNSFVERWRARRLG